MAAQGDLLTNYAASSNLSVTSLGAIATSSTYAAGWSSALIDNTTNKYDDYAISAKITVGTTLTAAQIRMYVARMLDDSTWPGNLTGSEAAMTFFGIVQMQAAWMKVVASTDTTTTNSLVYFLDCPSVRAAFGGFMPPKFVVCIAHATNANLAAAGSQQVTSKPLYYNVAP